MATPHRLHGSELTPVQIMEWCQTFHRDREWKLEQLAMSSNDIAVLLRSVADLIDWASDYCIECEMPLVQCVCCHEDL